MSGVGAAGGGGGGAVAAVSAVPAIGTVTSTGKTGLANGGGHSTSTTSTPPDSVNLSAEGIRKSQSLDKMSEALLAMLLLKLMEKASKA